MINGKGKSFYHLNYARAKKTKIFVIVNSSFGYSHFVTRNSSLSSTFLDFYIIMYDTWQASR